MSSRPRASQVAKSRSVPNDEIPLAPQPTEEQIRRRAYEIYASRGPLGGSDPDSDWRQAEEELRARLALLTR